MQGCEDLEERADKRNWYKMQRPRRALLPTVGTKKEDRKRIKLHKVGGGCFKNSVKVCASFFFLIEKCIVVNCHAFCRTVPLASCSAVMWECA